MNMDVTPIIFSFIFGISFLQECQLTPQWSFLFLSTCVFICYKQIQMAIHFVIDQENISHTVIYHVKKLRSLSKYHASNIDSIQPPLIGLKEEYNEESKEEVEVEVEEYDDVYHQSGCISPTPSLSTASTTSSIGSYDGRGGGRVEQMIHLFESGQLFHYHANEKKPFITKRRYNYDPTATDWQKRTLMVKSKFI